MPGAENHWAASLVAREISPIPALFPIKDMVPAI